MARFAGSDGSYREGATARCVRGHQAGRRLRLRSGPHSNADTGDLGMFVPAPGLQRLTTGCRDSDGGLERRFSWRGNVPVQNERAAYVVSGADWLALVEKFRPPG